MTTQSPGSAYGGLPLPLLAPTEGSEVGDPSATILSGYFAAVLNAYAQPAYSAVVPAVTGFTSDSAPLANPVVRKNFTHDPTEEDFAESDLPAVYVWRKGGTRPVWMAEDYRVSEDELVFLFVFQPAPQASRVRVQGFVNAVVKVADAAIESMRDPAYVALGDPDSTAGTTLPDGKAVKLPFAAPTSATTYSGSALDGPTGGKLFAPSQLPTVTVTGGTGTGVVQFIGLGSDGNLRVARVTLTGTGRFAGDFHLTQVQQVTVPAQVPGVTLALGLYGFVGLGTQVFVLGDVRVANVDGRQDPVPALMKCEIARWRQYRMKVEMSGGSPTRNYPHAVEIMLTTQERWFRYIPGPEPVIGVQVPVVTPPDPGTASNADLRDEALFQ